MTIAENITDAISFARSLGDVCLVVAIIGCIFMLMASACVLSFPNEHPDGSVADRRSPCSSRCTKRNRAAKPADGVLPAELWRSHSGPVRRAKSRFAGGRRRRLDQCQFAGCDSGTRGRPAHPWRQSQGVNLINIMPRARHDTLVLSDSDIVVGPNYLRTVTAMLSSASVGAVTCLYHGIGGEGVWTRLSALAINSQFLPQAITAVSLGLAQPCCGATIALRRPVLDASAASGRWPIRWLTITLSVLRFVPRATRSSPRRSWSGTAASRRACTSWCDSRSASPARSRASIRWPMPAR